MFMPNSPSPPKGIACKIGSLMRKLRLDRITVGRASLPAHSGKFGSQSSDMRAIVVYSEAMPVKLAVPDKLVENLKAILLPELRHLKDEISEFRKESAGDFRLVHTEMKALDERLTGQMKALDERLTGQMKALDDRLTGQMKVLDDRLTGRMDALEEKLTSRVVMLEMKLGSRLDNVEVRLASLEDRFNVRMTALEEKVTTTTQIRERLAVLEDRLPRQ